MSAGFVSSEQWDPRLPAHPPHPHPRCPGPRLAQKPLQALWPGRRPGSRLPSWGSRHGLPSWAGPVHRSWCISPCGGAGAAPRGRRHARACAVSAGCPQPPEPEGPATACSLSQRSKATVASANRQLGNRGRKWGRRREDGNQDPGPHRGRSGRPGRVCSRCSSHTGSCLACCSKSGCSSRSPGCTH